MEDAAQLGPKMRALPNDRWREFAVVVLSQNRRNYSAAYRAAFPGCNRNTSKTEGRRLAHDERMQAALAEEAGKQLKGLLPLALARVESVLLGGKDSDAAKAAFGVMDRAGLAVPVEHKHTIGIAGDTEMLARIKMLAERNGLSLESLVGNRFARAIDVTPGEPQASVQLQLEGPEDAGGREREADPARADG